MINLTVLGSTTCCLAVATLEKLIEDITEFCGSFEEAQMPKNRMSNCSLTHKLGKLACYETVNEDQVSALCVQGKA
jgi:hypothetical protein